MQSSSIDLIWKYNEQIKSTDKYESKRANVLLKKNYLKFKDESLSQESEGESFTCLFKDPII